MGGRPEQKPAGGAAGAEYRRAAALAMRRISLVVVEHGSGRARCSVVGVGRRLPVVRRVPLRVACALAEAGVPVVVRRASRPSPVPDVTSGTTTPGTARPRVAVRAGGG